MATKLNNPVRRELKYTGYGYKGRILPVIVTLKTNEILEFHVKGTRHRIEIGLSHCLNLAEIFSANQRFIYEMDKYKHGKRKRKPSRKFYPFSPVYFKAIETVKS